MTVSLANTEDKYRKVLEYLSSKGVFPLKGTDFWYIQIGDNMKAVAGFNRDTGGTIDPFVSEGAIFSLELYKLVEGSITTLGYKHIQVFTQNDVVIKKLINEEGYRIVNANTTCLIKEIE